MKTMATMNLDRNNIQLLRLSAERVAELVVSCKSCTTCCENGLVYIFNDEIEIMKALNVPLIEIKGIHYIQRLKGGRCPMLKKAQKKCTIYADRPVCCRLYPLDVFNRNGQLEWGLYTYCPEERKSHRLLTTANGRINYGLVLQALRMIEGTLGERRIQFLADEDLVSAEYEILDQFRSHFEVLGGVLMLPQHVHQSVISKAFA